MEPGEAWRGLQLQLIENDESGSGRGDYLNFAVELRAGDFSGYSEFWTVAGDLLDFVDRLEAFLDSLSGTVELTCGWADDIFRFHVARKDLSGGLAVRLEVVAADWTRRTERLSAEIASEPAVLARFAKALRSTVRDRVDDPLRLEDLSARP